MAGRIAARMAELGISLPPVVAPVATYVPTVRSGDMLYVSGQISKAADGSLMTGHLGAGVDVAAGAAAARVCALNILAQVAGALDGDLDRVVRVVKLVGFVASTPDFTDQPKVINGASDLLVEVLGEAGRHARSAVGVAALPLNVSVEVEAIFEVR
jgi:enamine deaminase RidA (YjgF/YER057c/UK114 family)